MLGSFALAQTSSPNNQQAKSDFSKEGVVIEQHTTHVDFNNDGTAKRQQKTRVRVQSEAGVQQYGVLSFPYQDFVEHLAIDYVRVLKPDGTVIVTPPDLIQDMPSEVSRSAPFYSDLKEKHVAVKRLGAGDILEYAATWLQDKPLAPGNFWFSWQFASNVVVLDEQLEISIPRDRAVKIKSQKQQPATRDEGNRRILTWKISHLESESKTAEKQELLYDSARGLLPPPDVMLSSFGSWNEVGHWYGSLQNDRVQPSPEIKAKATELTKGLTDDDSKIKAIYNYVSLRYRYIGIAFGIGRYQPHSAADILDNEYGDCKDKHTLLASLLEAVGIHAYPALLNSSRAVDPEVPSPGQFDHVITVIPKGSQLSWMDSTPEVAPLGYLGMLLRDKPALVIMPESSEFRITPANPPYGNTDDFTLTAKLDADGTLNAHVSSKERGDWEVLLRYAYRRTPQSQWKDLVQQISYGARLGGTISNPQASSPENTAEFFTTSYDYTIKDYTEGEKRRFAIPLPPPGLREPTDEDMNRRKPMFLGSPADWHYQARIELPKGFTVKPQGPIDLKNTFAEFESKSELKNGTLITTEHYVLKSREVAADQLTSYKTFVKAISDYRSTYVFLTLPGQAAADYSGMNSMPALPNLSRVSALMLEAFRDLPNSPNADALNAESQARTALQSMDRNTGIAALNHAVKLDPKFARAWIELGSMYAGTADKSLFIDSFQKAVEAEPGRALCYKLLAFAFAQQRNSGQAISTWKKAQEIAPDDPDIAPNLGGLYMSEKQYQQAAQVFEFAARKNPPSAFGQASLGDALLRSGEKERGLAALHKALEIDSNAEILNDVAYTMADVNTNLPEALGYAQRSVVEEETESHKVDLDNVGPQDLRLPMALSAYWDTLGWINFRMGSLPAAESYLRAAWQLRPDGTAGDHLGQVYEREKKLAEAVHMYRLALEVNPRMAETSERMRKLAQVHLPPNRMGAAEELSQMRTVKLPRIVKGSASADFYVLIAPMGKLKGSRFIRGSELLRFADDDLAKTLFKVAFPSDSSAYLLRKGILSCSSYTGCSFVFYPLDTGIYPN
jgi:tetratricopeptide (TPR) repeat protein